MKLSSRLSRLLVAWLSLFYILFPVAFFLNPSKNGTSNFFYLGILLPWLLLVCLGRVNFSYKSPVFISGAVLFSYLWISSFWNFNSSLSEKVYLAKWLVYSICLLSTPSIILRQFPSFYYWLIRIVFLAALPAVCIAIFQHYSAYGIGMFDQRLKSYGYGYSPISIAINFGLALLIGHYLMMHTKQFLWFIVLGCLLLLCTIMMTHSRGPILAVLVTLVLSFVLGGQSKRFLLIGGLFVGVSGIAFLLIGWDYMSVRGLSYRPIIWQQFIERGMRVPFVGEGFWLHAEKVPLNSRVFAEHGHNFILELFRYGGLVAVTLFMVHFLLLTNTLVKYKTEYSVLFFLMLLFTLMNMFVNGGFLLSRPNYYWFGYWYPVGYFVAIQVCYYERFSSKEQI